MTRDITIPYVYTTGLNLSNGNLSIGANTLTIEGTIGVVSGTVTGGNSSNILYSGDPSTILPAVAGGLNDLTIQTRNAATMISMTGNVTVNGTLSLTQGTLSNGNYLTMASGTTISRAAEGALFSAPTFAGIVDLLYTGTTPIIAGKELPTSASVINNLTTNPGGFTQYAENSSTTNLLTDPFTNLTNWAGMIGTGTNQYTTVASVNAGGTSPETRFSSTAAHTDSDLYIYRGPINTAGYDYLNVSFRSSAVGYYTQNYSTYLSLLCTANLADPFDAVWMMEYAPHSATTFTVPAHTTNVGGDFYVAFWYMGDPYATDYWYFDDLVIDGVKSTPVLSNVTINGTLYLVGDYTIGTGNTLAMANNATINRSGGALSAAPTFGTLVNLVYSNTSAITTAYENPGTGVDKLTLNNSAAVTLGQNTTVNAVVSGTGNLVFDGKLLTMNGKDFAVSGPGTISALSVALANEAQICNGLTSLAHAWTTSGTQNGNLAVTLSYPATMAEDDSLWVWTKTSGSETCWTHEGQFETASGPGSNRSLTVVFTSLNGIGRADKDIAITRQTFTLNVNSTGHLQPGTAIFQDSTDLGEVTNAIFTASNAAMICGSYSPGPPPAGYVWTTTPIVVSPGDFTAENGYEFTITFVLEEDDTLPVELSSFTAAMFGTNSVHITWVTQSETEVLGFHILRSLEEDLSTALQISDLIPATNTSQTKVYLYKDKDLNQEGTYYYWLQNTELNGETEYYGPINVVYSATQNETPTIPKVTGLSTIYPNPFNPSTTIKYGLANAETFDITIYNSRGQIVKVMERAHKEAGNYSAFWNGTDEQGKACGTGVYYVKMQAGKSSFTRKMVLMK